MRRRLIWCSMRDDNTIDMPDGAEVVSIEFHDRLGLGGDRHPTGVWVMVLVDE